MPPRRGRHAAPEDSRHPRRTHRTRLRRGGDRQPLPDHLGRGGRGRRSTRPGTRGSATSTLPRTTGSGSPNTASARPCDERPRDEYVVSSKVGRLLVPNEHPQRRRHRRLRRTRRPAQTMGLQPRRRTPLHRQHPAPHRPRPAGRGVPPRPRRPLAASRRRSHAHTRRPPRPRRHRRHRRRHEPVGHARALPARNRRRRRHARRPLHPPRPVRPRRRPAHRTRSSARAWSRSACSTPGSCPATGPPKA